MENLLANRRARVPQISTNGRARNRWRSYVANGGLESLSSYDLYEAREIDALTQMFQFSDGYSHGDSPRRRLALKPEYHFAYGVFFTRCRFRSGVPSVHQTGPRSPRACLTTSTARCAAASST